MITLLWTEPAIKDLQDIKAFLEPDSPTAAIKWVSKVLDAAERLTQFPELGKKVEEADCSDIRELIIGKTYRLIYLWDKPVISILAVEHARKSLAAMKLKPWDIV